jgi:hypothetical protein
MARKNNATPLRRDKNLPSISRQVSSNKKKLLASQGFKKALAIGATASISMAGLFGLGGHLTGVHKGAVAERARIEHLQKAGFAGPAMNKFSRLADIYKLDLRQKKHVDFLHLVNVVAKEVRISPDQVFYNLEELPKGIFKSQRNINSAIARLPHLNLTENQALVRRKIIISVFETARLNGNASLAHDLAEHVRRTSGSRAKLVNDFKL